MNAPDEMHQENRELRRQLQALIANARDNEQILRRQQELELRLIGVRGLVELVDEVLEHYRRAVDLDRVTLSLVDPDYEIAHMLADLGVDTAQCTGLQFLEDNLDIARLYPPPFDPLLGPYDEESQGFLFPCGEAPESVALIPLVRDQVLIGSLNLGSRERGRFISGMATDFIRRMGGIVAICLENVINREKLRHFGLTDPLTKIHNRRYFDQRLCDEVARLKRHREGLSCLFFDVDHFKRINDTRGHQVGDRVLQEVARRLKEQLRACDVLGRYGGEEFAALLTQTGEEGAVATAERVRQAIAARPIPVEGEEPVSVTISVGVATLWEPPHDTAVASSAQHLLARADAALYRAKETGRNKVMAADS